MAIRTPKEIESYFEEFVFGLISGDCDAVIRARANYSAALCLLSYTEFVGGLVDGSLGKSGASRKRFNHALSYFRWNGDENYYRDFKLRFVDLDGKEKDGDIYGLFRCGLAHEYFVKGDSFLHNNPDGRCVPEDAGVQVIEHDGEKRLRFHTNAYFRDFKDACKRYYEDLKAGDTDLAAKLNEALDRIESRSIVF